MYFKPRTVIFHLLASYNNYFPFSPLKAHPLKLMEKKKKSAEVGKQYLNLIVEIPDPIF